MGRDEVGWTEMGPRRGVRYERGEGAVLGVGMRWRGKGAAEPQPGAFRQLSSRAGSAVSHPAEPASLRTQDPA